MNDAGDGILIRMTWTDGTRKFEITLNVDETLALDKIAAIGPKVTALIDIIDESELGELFMRP